MVCMLPAACGMAPWTDTSNMDKIGLPSASLFQILDSRRVLVGTPGTKDAGIR